MILIFVLSAAVSFAQYNKDAVVTVMRENASLMGELQGAAKKGDFFTAAEKLMGIAKNMKSLETITPKKGGKSEWDRIHGDLIKAAFRGIGACGDEDRKKLESSIAEIERFIKTGHEKFR